MIGYELVLGMVFILVAYVTCVKMYREKRQKSLSRRAEREVAMRRALKLPDDINTPEWYQTPEQVTAPQMGVLEDWWKAQQHAKSKACFDTNCWTHYPPGKFMITQCDSPFEHMPHRYTVGGTGTKCPGKAEEQEIRGDDQVIRRSNHHDDCYLCDHPELP